ncbi:MAG: hypothetical protein KR126chlam1_00138 [Chlamydiae bacterium]|nr:hypothetical protein [Chlamydiota bacterium]
MSNREITNISASIRARLLNKAREDKRPFNELLQYFAMERFLYRLSISPYSQKFILKGALMFTAWELVKHRATIDIDISARTLNSVENLIEIVQDICEIQPDIDDGLIFDGRSVIGKMSQKNAEYSGVQLKFEGKLNKAKISMKVDVGFGDIISPSPLLIIYPTILPLPSPQIKGYPPETVIAEKFQTILLRGMENSRMKDFYDIWMLQKQMQFLGNNLLEAISKTFSNRQTKINNDSLNNLKLLGESQDKAKQWEQFVRKNRFDSETPNFKSIINAIFQFLMPIVIAIDEETRPPGKWNPSKNWSKN